MSENTTNDERRIHEVTQKITNLLLDFDDEAKRRIFRTALTFYGLEATTHSVASRPLHTKEQSQLSNRTPNFTEHSELPAKDFLFQKQPGTDIERVACLAYYLMHYRDTKHFKTIDLSKLNTEAAQIKFSNTAFTVANATNGGLLAQAGKGNKQLSALGERFVEALPDREAAKAILADVRSRRNRKTTKKKVTAS